MHQLQFETPDESYKVFNTHCLWATNWSLFNLKKLPIHINAEDTILTVHLQLLLSKHFSAMCNLMTICELW